MTKEKIMIDGIDVRGCQYLYFAIEDSIIDYKEYPHCSIGEAFTNNACKNSNCYYKQLKRKIEECERLKWYLNEIRDDELKTLDVEWDEYETQCNSTEYSNIINLVEEALEERSPEDCRYGK